MDYQVYKKERLTSCPAPLTPRCCVHSASGSSVTSHERSACLLVHRSSPPHHLSNSSLLCISWNSNPPLSITSAFASITLRTQFKRWVLWIIPHYSLRCRVTAFRHDYSRPDKVSRVINGLSIITNEQPAAYAARIAGLIASVPYEAAPTV